MTSPPPLASLQNPQINKDLGWDPGELLRSDFVDTPEREAFPNVLSEERAYLNVNRSNESKEPVDATDDPIEEHDPQLNAAGHSAPAEQREANDASKSTAAHSKHNEQGEKQGLQASEADQNIAKEEAENERVNDNAQSEDLTQSESSEDIEMIVAEELALAQAQLQDMGHTDAVQAQAAQQAQALAAAQGSMTTHDAKAKAQETLGGSAGPTGRSSAQVMETRVDSTAEKIVDYLADHGTREQQVENQRKLVASANANATQSGIVGEQATAENLNATRDILQNLNSTDGTQKGRTPTQEAQPQQRAAQSVNVTNTTPAENRLAGANMQPTTNAALASSFRQGAGAGQGEQNWDGLPGQASWQASIAGSKNTAGKQIPITQHARNLMMQAAQTLPAQKGVEGRRLSLTLPMEKHGPVRMILRPGPGDTHQMTFIVNSANAAAALRRILPELEETASTFPVEVADISIVTQENQATTEDPAGFRPAESQAGLGSLEV